jgi:hypothetical protein
LKDDYFLFYFIWLVLKAEISYKVRIYLEGFFGFLLEDFIEDYVYFCMVKHFE